jgi:hypothetical protein
LDCFHFLSVMLPWISAYKSLWVYLFIHRGISRSGIVGSYIMFNFLNIILQCFQRIILQSQQ